jgi:hypothetical protein
MPTPMIVPGRPGICTLANGKPPAAAATTVDLQPASALTIP